MERSDKIAFIHILRGIAPLLVLWAHLGGWWLAVSNKTSILQTVWVRVVDFPLHIYQDGGHLGVLIFFLVSGFVITHVSLRESRTEFAIKRAFRLAPLLWLAFILTAILVKLSASAGLPPIIGHESGNYFASVTMLNWFLGKPGALTVVWTLWIEVMFYVLTWLFINLSRRSPVYATWLMLAFPVAGDMATGWWGDLVHTMFGAMYIPYLLIGRSAYLAWSKRASGVQATSLGAACFLAFLIIYNNRVPGSLLQPNTEVIVSDLIAIILFVTLCFSGIEKVPAPLSFFGNICYSLYLLHAPVGSFLLNVLTVRGLSYEAALPIAVAGLCLVCWATYIFVEQPAQALGRSVIRRLGATYDRPNAPGKFAPSLIEPS